MGICIATKMTADFVPLEGNIGEEPGATIPAEAVLIVLSAIVPVTC